MRPLTLAVALAAGCSHGPSPTVPAAPEGPQCALEPGQTGGNVLLILLDDVGPEIVASWQVHPDPPHTPTLDRLAEEGMSFQRTYAAPLCTPGRAQLLTGRYGRRYGVAHNLPWKDQGSLPLAEVTLAEVVHHSPHGRYETAGFGKWHLVTGAAPDPLLHPNDQGFDHYDGTLSNLSEAAEPEEGVRHDYFHWERLLNGDVEHIDAYNPSFTIDRAVEHLDTLPEPWLAYLPLHSAHGPNHVPPDPLHSRDVTDDDPDHAKFAAMVEAADTELGRLLDSLDPEVLDRTTILVAGDNGAWEKNVPEPWDVLGGKTTMTEGGLRVPLIVRSPLVVAPGSRTQVPVHLVDVLPTIADLACVDPADLEGPEGPGLLLDGLSLVPLLLGEEDDWAREAVYAELAGPPGPPPYDGLNQRAMMSRTHKAWFNAAVDGWKLHTIGDSPADESDDLLESGLATAADLEAYDELRAGIEGMVDELQYTSPWDEAP